MSAKKNTMKMIRYTCPVCWHSGAHGVDMKAPLCDKCNYKVTMIVTDAHTKLVEALKDFDASLQNKVDRAIFTKINAENLK
jgi:ribosomal protein L37AE/L43A